MKMNYVRNIRNDTIIIASHKNKYHLLAQIGGICSFRFFSNSKKLAYEPHSHADAMNIYMFTAIASLLVMTVVALLALFDRQIAQFVIEHDMKRR